MFGLVLACISAAVAWVVSFNKLIVIGDEPDPFGLLTYYPRLLLLGGGIIFCCAVARYLTRRHGRGLRVGLVNFTLLAMALMAIFCLGLFMNNGGTYAETEALVEVGRQALLMYGACITLTVAAFMTSEMMTGRL